ncbi:hypothetical protein ElyMa_002640700 [Elysia marginata]|uniref:Uncharacterized protein n=1 Tax=Elysia marginata TaxID=1093978 RepID=A0AAV4H612_9GAST|nr:hypothetical protein ElyMa_002640700 [Elysia marginata]
MSCKLAKKTSTELAGHLGVWMKVQKTSTELTRHLGVWMKVQKTSTELAGHLGVWMKEMLSALAKRFASNETPFLRNVGGLKALLCGEAALQDDCGWGTLMTSRAHLLTGCGVVKSKALQKLLSPHA